MGEVSIRSLIEDVRKGQIRIPAFQRGFVWDHDRIAFLMDSIYKGYPFGSVILWRTKEQLKSERKLGPFSLPEPGVGFPIDYVLDGQQRLTSIFGTFQTDLESEDGDVWPRIYFDMEAEADLQESQFLVLDDSKVDHRRHFPINTFFDTTAYRRATSGFPDDKAELIDRVQAVFKEAKIPTQDIVTDDRGKVGIVFERVNRLGVELDVMQLLSAWTWSEDFDLQSRFGELSDELSSVDFGDIGEDTTLLLRCCAAVIAKDTDSNTLMNMNGADVRERFGEISNGIRGAIDFVRNSLGVRNIKNLPYPTVLIPLTVFFASKDGVSVKVSSEQRKVLLQWLWRSFFSRRFSAGVRRNLKRDIAEIVKLKKGEPSVLADFPAVITADFFAEKEFNISRVDSKTFTLLLVSATPLSFISGSHVSLDRVLLRYNRSEFHHLMPKAFLSSRGG
ncbi:GmrSD restriction endonuclease domain-containing protein [Dermabacteraceae bacterium P9123]